MVAVASAGPRRLGGPSSNRSVNRNATVSRPSWFKWTWSTRICNDNYAEWTTQCRQKLLHCRLLSLAYCEPASFTEYPCVARESRLECVLNPLSAEYSRPMRCARTARVWRWRSLWTEYFFVRPNSVDRLSKAQIVISYSNSFARD